MYFTLLGLIFVQIRLFELRQLQTFFYREKIENGTDVCV